MTQQEKIYREVANTLQIDLEVAERVCKSMFEFLADTMREEKYQPYRIQGLGRFEVKPYMKEKCEKTRKNKEAREQRNRELYNSIGSGSTTKSHGCEDGSVDSTEQKETLL